MDKWANYILAAVLALSSWLLPACGGGTEQKVPTIGFLQFVTHATVERVREGYLQALADSGFVDGKTVRIILKDAQGDLPTAQLIARDFVSQRVDLIATAATASLQAAMNSTSDIPIVFSYVADPILAGAGETSDKHRPNVTGSFTAPPVGETMALLQEIMPNIRNIGTLYDPNEAFTDGYLEMARQKANELSLDLVEIAVNSPTDIVPGVQALKARGAEAIMQIPGALLDTGIDSEIQEARKRNMPLVSVHPAHVKSGSLAAFGTDYWQAGYDAGQIAVRVLRGEKPSAIPFQPPSKIELYLNVETAKTFNITFSEEILGRAQEVIGQSAN